MIIQFHIITGGPIRIMVNGSSMILKNLKLFPKPKFTGLMTVPMVDAGFLIHGKFYTLRKISGIL